MGRPKGSKNKAIKCCGCEHYVAKHGDYCFRCRDVDYQKHGHRTLDDIVQAEIDQRVLFYGQLAERGEPLHMRTIADIFRSYGVLDADGRHINGTDKQTNHAYGDVYERILDDKFGMGCDSRNRVNLMMEIGVADGSSLLAWSEVFPKALCVGLDIHWANRLGVISDRIEFHLGDQRSCEDCERAAGGRMFDVIVEDATHQLANTLLTMYWLWPFVRQGGLYIIEEWDNVGSDRDRIRAMWPSAEIVDTTGPFGGVEPLVVLRKPI